MFEGMNDLLGYSYVFRVIQLTSSFPVSSSTNKSLLYLNLFDANYILYLIKIILSILLKMTAIHLKGTCNLAAMQDGDKNLKKVRCIADYQFGRGCGDALFSNDVTFLLSRTNRVRQILQDGQRIATVRAKDGMLTLSIAGAMLLHDILPAPSYRVIVCDDAVPFVSKGKTVFSKHIISMDKELRAGEEVLVVDASDKLLATGQLLLSPDEALSIGRGPGVDVRNGIDQDKDRQDN